MTVSYLMVAMGYFIWWDGVLTNLEPISGMQLGREISATLMLLVDTEVRS